MAVKDSENRPITRSGHLLFHYEGNLVLFGGIHDITRELDDLQVYSI